jgi:hypothetical protein
MAQKLRFQCPGAIHQVMKAGDRQELVFLDDSDCCLFAPSGQASGWQWVSEKRPIGGSMNTETKMVKSWETTVWPV